MAFTLRTQRQIQKEVDFVMSGVKKGHLTIKDVEDFEQLAVSEEEYALAECYHLALQKFKDNA